MLLQTGYGLQFVKYNTLNSNLIFAKENIFICSTGQYKRYFLDSIKNYWKQNKRNPAIRVNQYSGNQKKRSWLTAVFTQQFTGRRNQDARVFLNTAQNYTVKWWTPWIENYMQRLH